MLKIPSEISQESRGTQGTSSTSRALNLLESVKLATRPAENQEFIKILSLFKQKKISSSEAFQRVSSVLQNYPKLLNEFKSYLPPPSAHQSETTRNLKAGGNLQHQPQSYGTFTANPNQPLLEHPKSHAQILEEDVAENPELYYKPTQFSSALAFIQKVKLTYENEPDVYDKFLELLKNYQRGAVNQQEVVVNVESLLSRTPGLAYEFKSYYGNEAEVQGLPRADSNDTMADSGPALSHQQPQQPRTLSFASSAPMASVAATTITPENYANAENEPLLASNNRTLTLREAEAQITADSMETATKFSPALVALSYFSLFLTLFVGAIVCSFYYGLLDLSIFEGKKE